jgi:hypothetical protein
VHDVDALDANPFTLPASLRARTHLIDSRYFGESRMCRDTLQSLTNEEEIKITEENYHGWLNRHFAS